AIWPERINATGRVNRPTRISSPPKNSSTPATPINESHEKLGGCWPLPGIPKSFWLPCCRNRSPMTMRMMLRTRGDHVEQEELGFIIQFFVNKSVNRVTRIHARFLPLK